MMKQESLISVIVPIYKVEQYLEKCINSIIAQTYTNLEIILVDDGSPDNCGRICDEYAKKDDRITVIHQENMGQAGARNHGLDIANGDYIGFVDGDDWIAPDMYENLLNVLTENDCDISVCGRFSVRKDVITESKCFNMQKVTIMDTTEVIKRFLTYKAFDAAIFDKLYKKEILKGIKFPLGFVSEDVPFAYEALSRAKKIVHCAKPLYYYLHRDGSTSRSVFSPKSMGVYYYYKDVCEKSLRTFPELRVEAEYIYFKNLLVLSYMIASMNAKTEYRKLVNDEVKRNVFKILSNKYIKKMYKIYAVAVLFHVEKMVVKVGDNLKLYNNNFS